jgi:hypothetical protein
MHKRHWKTLGTGLKHNVSNKRRIIGESNVGVVFGWKICRAVCNKVIDEIRSIRGINIGRISVS